MKAIILAAGPSSRMRPLTDDSPKTLVPIEGKPILQRLLEAYRSCGIDEIAVVRGYQKEKFTIPNLTYFDNDNYLKNNILSSLFYAEEFMQDEFLVSYCDILYSKEVIQKLLDSPHDISLIIDTEWEERYKGRTEHPTDEAELACVEDGLVTRLSKFFNPAVAYGEFIGLAKFSKKGSETFRRNYYRVRDNKWCKFEGRFHDATILDYAYLTDMIQELIARGYPVHSVDIQKGWVEIDTMQDYEYAKQLIKKGLL
ncbi:MAG: phosphocholine cytidylyltransferase family protein [Candidatus Heimdallarchaeota archaeon]|nr:phosphocholine cytidylyltransferase family protein [Candidatus Heimdallarchaeota archaeon]